jgi:NodT family efflux transporter outer membrane factor (OMF) lipoprotein
MSRRGMSAAQSAALGLAGALGGCAVGPNFHEPAAPPVEHYTAAAPSVAAEGSAAQRFVSGMNLPGEWWTVFHSDALNTLVKEALQHNPNMQAAQAALRQANETTSAQRGFYVPTLAASYGATRQKNAVGTLSPTLNSGAELFTLHTAEVSVSYMLDVFGGNRRQVESLQALADAARFELAGTYLTLSSNVVAAAVEEASLRAQIAATSDVITSERESLQILEHQYEIGAIARLDVMAQESALASTEATLPGLQKQLAQERDLIAVLVGRLPSDEPVERFTLEDLTLPQDLPLSVPAALVRQRPDVLQAEAQLHSATAQVGVALANLLPQISLTGSAGGTSTALAQLFASGNTFWTGGGTLSQTLFAGGTLWHRKRAADAALDQAGAQYRSTVLAAFQQVADTLHALELDAATEGAAGRAERAAADSLPVVRHNVELGSVSYLALLQSQQSYQQARLALAQARASRFADTAALFQALGGGWWNDPSSGPKN